MEPEPEPDRFKESENKITRYPFVAREQKMETDAADNASEEAGLITPRILPGHIEYYKDQTFHKKYKQRLGIGNTRKVYTLSDNKVHFKGPGKRLQNNHMTRRKISRILDNAQLTVEESDDPAKSLIFVGKALQHIGIKIEQPVTEEDADEEDEHREGGRRTRKNRKSRKKFKRNNRKSRR
jgi:hypothetical protein